MTDGLDLLKRCLMGGPMNRDQLAWAYSAERAVDLSTADRMARKDIEEARKTTEWGALILPDPYRIATSDEELAGFLASERRRGLSILVRVREQRRRGLEALRALPLRQGEMFR